MSKLTDNVQPIIVDANSVEEQAVSEEKQSFGTKLKTFARTHKKALIAGGALTGLVALAAATSRQTAPSPDPVQPLELEAAADEDTIVVEAHDTTVA